MMGQGLASVVAAQPLMFTRYAMHWIGDGSLFPYTGRTPAQCFLCFLMYNYAYFNFIICMFFYLYYMFCNNHCIKYFTNKKK